MRKIQIFCLLFFISCLNFAQGQECACCTVNHIQFDFWVGDWEVFNTKGDKIGENLIKKLEDNCIINENWQSVSGNSGNSYNYFDPKDSTWNQLWLSNDGTILKLKGELVNNKMILKSEPVSSKKQVYYNQITWSPNSDGSVSQIWETYNTEDLLLNTLFNGIYKRK
ncbi:hypothetical protein [Christiangramia salexigens]|uniref:Uncharacterized protein n=1 Tax=Christiangramia salexigens TaxID=1913577 RepID=A0A1L3J7E0_9FLAO|nr:hypothetical protein [Christiangramia salexigens]APG61013.1 hypothetical protein LPB144_11610 [Christiangramia salexigens]